MRVLHVASHNSFMRGGAVQILRMAEGQSIFGASGVILLNRKVCGHIPEKIGNFKIKCLPLSFNKLLKFLKLSKDFDIIHAHKLEALRFSILSHLFFKKPVVFQRGTTYKLKGIYVAILKGFPLNVIAVSHAVKKVLVSLGIPDERIHVIYGSAPLLSFKHNPSSENRFGIVAAFTGKKGYPLFFSIAENIKRILGNAKFYIYGSGRKEKFKNYVNLLKDALVFKGYLSDLAEIYSCLDMVLCTSLKGEGFTGSVREAMLYGILVATTFVSGNPEFIDHGKTGIIVDIDPSKASHKILNVVFKPFLKRKMALNAKRKAVKFFTIERQAKRLIDIYRSVK